MSHGSPTSYPEINAVLCTFLADVRAILGSDFVGMYLYGSLALGDFAPDRSSDSDCLVVTGGEIGDATITTLAALHARMSAGAPGWAAEIGILHTVGHGRVVSKPAAARWAVKTLGEPWSPLIELALARGRGQPFEHLGTTMDLIRYTLSTASRRGGAARPEP